MKRRVLSLICTLAILLGMVTVPAFAADAVTGAATNGEETYSSLQAAVDDYFFGVIVLQEDAQDVTVSRDVYLDLNGHNVADVTVTGGTLYVSDSQTDDYTVADGSYGKVTGITGAVEAAEGYLAVGEEESVSFHCVDLQIKAMSLRPGVAGVYYTSNFAGDEVVAEQVQSYGIALSIAGEPAEENLETTCGYSTIIGFEAGENANAANGTLLTGIMSDEYTAEENAENAAMPVYGRAYIKTAEGYVFGACVSRDLQTQVEAIDSIWGALTETQKAGVLDMYDAYSTAMADWNIPNIRGEQMDEVVITVPVQTEDNVVTEEITVEQDGVTITIPFGALLEAGVEELTLTVTSKASDSGVVLEEGQVLLPLDVHVEGISADNTVPLTVALGKVLPENLNLGNYDLYHVEKTGTKQMELVANGEEFTAHNQFKYTLDGELTLHTATFSGFPVVFSAENVWNGERDYTWYDAEATELNIRNADQLAGFSAIVGGMDGQTQDSFSGKTVKLLADIRIGDLDSENGIVFYPVGYYNSEGTYEKSGTAITSGFKTFEGIFDGNGNTISEFYQNTWEMKGDHEWYAATEQHYRDGMGLFGKVYGGTVKNLTVDSFSSDGEITTTGVIAAYADCAAVFENIAIVNCNPRVYNIGNGGIVGCVGWYAKTDVEQPVSFRNITVDNSNKISALWGSWDVACGGLVGQYYPTSGQTEAIKNKGISFDNCHVAAQIDVYNDVCANYQYYAYRYAGMIIGSIRENVTVDGYVYPNMDGITATKCTVHLGDWNDYYYCELVANSLASYTHDHQMSRLEQVISVDVENKQIVTLKGETVAIPETGRYNYVVVKSKNDKGEWIHGDGDDFAECYHFVDGAVWNHEDAGYEEVDTNGDGIKENVLMEDKQHIYREFNQLFTGYGWGVTSKGLEDVQDMGLDVLVLDRLPSSEVKFDSLLPTTLAQNEENLVIAENTVLSVEQIFSVKPEQTEQVKADKIQVFISPADETSTVEAVNYVSTGDDWATGTLQFKGRGAATVTITDYYFCTPTVINVTVDSVKAAADAMEYDTYIVEETNVVDGVETTTQYVPAICPACAFINGDTDSETKAETVNWTILAAKATKYNDGVHKHFYLDKNTTYTGLSGIIQFIGNTDSTDEVPNNSGTPGCINLNGRNIKSTSRVFYAESSKTVLNIMGTGTVTGGTATYVSTNYSGSAVDITTRGNLFGGTYTGTKKYPVISLRGSGKHNVLNVWEGTLIKATYGRSVYVSHYGTFNMYGGEVRGGKAINPDTKFEAINGYGGAVIVNSHSNSAYAASFNLYGGTVTGGTAENGGASIAVIDSAAAGAKSSAVLNIAGGTIKGGDVYYSGTNASIELSGAPVVSEIKLDEGQTVNVGEMTDGAEVSINAENGAIVSGELNANQMEYGKYFHSTIEDRDVTVDGSVLKVTDDVCVHCDTANTEIDWKNLTQDTMSDLRVRCTYEKKAYYYLPTGHYKLYAEGTQEERIINLTQQLMIGDYGGTATGDVAFDLNGATMKATSNNRAMLMSNASTLSVMDTSSENPEDWGAIIGGYISASGASIYAGEGSTINLYSGIIKWERKEGTTDVPHSGTIDAKGTVINLYGGILGGTDVRGYGGTIYAVEDSEINLYEGATIQAGTSGTVNGVSNTSAGKGGTIYLKESKLNVYGGTIEEGSSLRGGDTIYALTSSTTNFLGGTVHGQIYLGSTTTVNLAGAPVLEHLEMQEGTKVTIGELTADANITVNATGAFTDTLTNADAVQSYIDAGYINLHSSLEGKVLAIVEGVLTVTVPVVEEPEETVPEETVPEETVPEETTEPTEETTAPTE